LLLACALARAQDAGHIDTDGPDFVESTEAVPRGRVQFEAGPMWEVDGRAGTRLRTLSTPLLLKGGLGEGRELRLEADGLVHQSGTDAAGAPAALRGAADTALGMKWHVQDRDEKTGRPAVAWIAHVELPGGSAKLRGLGLRPSLRAVIGWDLPGGASIGLMPGVQLDTREDGQRFVSGIFGAVAGKWFTPRLRGFVELQAARIAHARDGGALLYQNAGAAWLLGEDWQIGARAGWAANRNTPSRYLLIALAGRF
jgi:hypothetical protein